MNTISYRFYSEKEFYEIRFPNMEMSIEDITSEIIKKRNMHNPPESLEFIFYYEENLNQVIDKTTRIQPMKRLIVKRFPRYKFNSNFIPYVKEPSEISMNTKNEAQATKRFSDPLEKIAEKLTKGMINKLFKCRICQKDDSIDPNYVYESIITFCCKETICKNCFEKSEKNCPFCHGEKKGYTENLSDLNLRKKLIEIYEKREEEKEKLKLHQMAINSHNEMKLNSMGGEVNIQKNPQVKAQGDHGIGVDANFSNANCTFQKKNTFNGTIIEKNTNAQINELELNTVNQYSGNKIIKPQIGNPYSEMISLSQNLVYSLIDNSRFFIIKCSNNENINKSRESSVWATTFSKQKTLNDAFSKGNVILIFSVNGTACIQGFAIMTSYSAEKPNNNFWKNENNVKLGGDFSVTWLCYCELNFKKINHLQNPENNNEPVIKSRDCTKLAQNIGYELCKICLEQEKFESENSNRPRVQVTEQLIEKINEEIKNNKNKQTTIKNNTSNSNNNLSSGSTQNPPRNDINAASTIMPNSSNDVAMPQNPFQTAMRINPYYMYQFMPKVVFMPQQQGQEGMPGMMRDIMIGGNQMQNNPQMENQNKTNEKKEKEVEEKPKDKKGEHEGHHHKHEHHSHHHKRKEKSSRSNSKSKRSRKSRSRSRSRGRSRSSRYSDDKSRKERGKSHHSKNYK